MGRTVRAAGAGLLKASPLDRRICGSCLRTMQQQQRHAATATASSIPNPEPTPEIIKQGNPSVLTATAPHQAYQVRAGVVLSRPPLITRDLSAFERSFYLYQRRLNERLALNFSRYFYFPPDTQAEREWKRKMKERVTPARDIGGYIGKGKLAWNDEVLVGAQESETDFQLKTVLEDAAVEVEEENQEDNPGGETRFVRQEVEPPEPRITEADQKGDTKSLNRALQRTLYLLVRTRDGKWEFPADVPVGQESLHRAAERVLVEGAGPNMNTWMVARHPVGWHEHSYGEAAQEKETGIERLGEKTFFIKGRIMAGQADLAKNKFGFKDFKWLSKEEIEKQVDPAYWRSIKNMLVGL